MCNNAFITEVDKAEHVDSPAHDITNLLLVMMSVVGTLNDITMDMRYNWAIDGVSPNALVCSGPSWIPVQLIISIDSVRTGRYSRCS